MMYTIEAFQFSDSIKIKPVRDFFKDFYVTGDTDELFFKIDNNSFFYVFKYGVICFFNVEKQQQLPYLKQIEPYATTCIPTPITEKQILENGNSITITSESIVVDAFEIDTVKLVMFSVSQSVALDYYHSISEQLLEDTRVYTDKLEHVGKINLSGKRLKKYIGRVLNIRNRVVENLYIFEGPDVTWDNDKLNRLDQDLKKHFDLQDRYRAVHEQVDIVKENLELFKDLMFHSESSRLEWVIIILILVEVVDLFLLKLV